MEIIERVDWRNWGFALYLYSQANEMRADAMPALLYMYAFFVAVLRAKDQESLEASIAWQDNNTVELIITRTRRVKTTPPNHLRWQRKPPSSPSSDTIIHTLISFL